MSAEMSWEDFKRQYHLDRVLPDQSAVNDAAMALKDATLSVEQDLQMRRDMAAKDLSTRDLDVRQHNVLFNQVAQALNQDMNVYVTKLELAMNQAHTPRRDAPKNEATLKAGMSANELKPAPWANFSDSAANQLQDMRDNLADRAAASEFSDKAMKDLAEADMTLRAYAAHKMKMGGPKPGSSGGKKLEQEPGYTYSAPKLKMQ